MTNNNGIIIQIHLSEFVDEIDESMRFVRKNYRFASEADKALALGRFEQGRQIYAKLVSQGQ